LTEATNDVDVTNEHPVSGNYTQQEVPSSMLDGKKTILLYMPGCLWINEGRGEFEMSLIYVTNAIILFDIALWKLSMLIYLSRQSSRSESRVWLLRGESWLYLLYSLIM